MIGYQRERLHHLLHMSERFLSGEAASPRDARDLEGEAEEILAGDAELDPLAKALGEALQARSGGPRSGGEREAAFDPERVRPAVRALRDALARRLP